MTPNPNFPSTQWTRLERDRGGDGTMDWFCEAYRPAVLAYLRRHVSHHDAEDLCQEFFRRELLGEGPLVERVDRERGSLRALLRTALSRYLVNHWRRTGAIKRGGQAEHCSLEDGEVLAAPECAALCRLEPDRAFDRAWAGHLLERALSQVQNDCAAKGKQALFTALRPQLSAAAPGRHHAEIGQELGMSGREITLALRKLRLMVGRSLYDEVVATVSGRGSVADEWEAVRTALRDD